MAGKTELTLEQQIEELNKKLAKQAEQNKELTASLQKKDEELAQKEEVEAELVQALRVAEASKGSTLPVVEHEGVQYRLLAAKADIRKEKYTAEKIAESPELIAYLVGCGSGILQEISI